MAPSKLPQMMLCSCDAMACCEELKARQRGGWHRCRADRVKIIVIAVIIAGCLLAVRAALLCALPAKQAIGPNICCCVVVTVTLSSRARSFTIKSLVGTGSTFPMSFSRSARIAGGRSGVLLKTYALTLYAPLLLAGGSFCG